MFQETFVVVVLGLAVFYLLKYLKNLHRYYTLLFRLRSPKWVPFIGHLRELLDERQILNKVRRWSRELGPVYFVSVFYFTIAGISGAEEFETITSSMKHSQKGRLYFLLHNWLGQGLLTSSGSQWQTRRKILTPAFHFSILRDFVNVFNKETDKLVEILKQETGKAVNVVPLISQCTLSSIVETAMGCKLNLQNASDTNYVHAIHNLGKILYYKLIRPWLHIRLARFTPTGRAEMKLINTINNFTNKVIKLRQENFVKLEELSTNDSEESHAYSGKKKLVMLDLLLNAKLTSGVIDDQGIKDEVNTIMFEGHDTTATAICFILMLLACHRKTQDLVYDEIIQMSQEHQKHFNMNELLDLKYMECVIKEGLRLYPSVPFIARTLDEDMTTSEGFILPGNTEVHIHVFDIHRDPKFWPEPDKFDPDRFLPENCVNRHPFAYVPFSAGPRNCIGQRFAMLEIKAVLVGILRNFILEPIDTPETIQIVPDVVLRPLNDTLLVKFTSRT